MAVVTIELPDGRSWVPRFAVAIDKEKCIGCGRCYKVCGRDVMKLVPVDEEGNFIDEDADEDEYEKQVMVLSDQMKCIGCEACSRVCPKNCYTHAEMATN